MATYTNETKPSAGSNTLGTKPTNISVSSGSSIGLLLSLTYALAVSLYTQGTKPSAGSNTNLTKPT